MNFANPSVMLVRHIDMPNSKDEPICKSEVDLATEPVAPTISIWAIIKKAIKRISLSLLFLVLGYLGIALIGLIPVNRDFVEAENGIEVLVFSGEFHSDLILPIRSEVIDWRTQFDPADVQGETAWATHMTFGWGDRQFYLNTPTWSDLKVSTATNALLWPSETVMHVGYATRPTENASIRSVKISAQQYQLLVDYVLESFASDDNGSVRLISGESYHQHDAFYHATGNYHCFRTCNCWAGQAIKSAGIKTGWFTPFPKTPFLYFPE